ncbi:MAG TPA: hypothetical protein VNG29_03090 [Candidatus Paceibacterota bacterium]|nr:hypothetical protein [Candidatus Paceibacterota bacterium]
MPHYQLSAEIEFEEFETGPKVKIYSNITATGAKKAEQEAKRRIAMTVHGNKDDARGRVRQMNATLTDGKKTVWNESASVNGNGQADLPRWLTRKPQRS